MNNRPRNLFAIGSAGREPVAATPWRENVLTHQSLSIVPTAAQWNGEALPPSGSLRERHNPKPG